ncbi:MAG: DUF2066 domain-containing protein [Rhodanobacteraceae bacterium]
MMRILLSLLLACGVAAGALAQTAAPAAAPAAVSANPYSATVPVAGTSDTQRDVAISAALAGVLQQVSPGFSAPPEVLAQASGYVRAYHYRRAATGGLELQVDFDPGAIGRMVAQAQNAVTGTVAGQPGVAGSAAAVAAAQAGTGTLWVGGIENDHALAALLSTLRNDPAMSDVIPVAAEGDGVLLQLTSDQPLATALAGLTGPAGHLAPAAQPHPGADDSFRWVP